MAAQAVDEAGKAAAVTEREVAARWREDGSFVASYGMALKPGATRCNVAVLDTGRQRAPSLTSPSRCPTSAPTSWPSRP